MGILTNAFMMASFACAFHQDADYVDPRRHLARVLFAVSPTMRRRLIDSGAAHKYAVHRAGNRAEAPTMILDQMQKAADDLKGAAAETIIAQKVADKLAKAKEKYTIPQKYEGVMASLFTSYMTEVYKAGKDTDHFESLLTQLFKKVLEKFKEPYKFEPYHEAMREPFDYYALGTEFVSGVVNSEKSVVIGEDKVAEMLGHIRNGDNVVLLANHQSEADPQIFSVLLDPKHPGFAESTIFVAGDRVTTDLFAQPFSMGRNLLCIFSKKHIENPPEQKSEKTKHNRKVMQEMKKLFTAGGKIIWVAPSGGRDRKGSTGKYEVAPFDSKSIEMFRIMADKAKKKTHFYPLSMLTHTIAPAPEAVGGDVGEFRAVAWAPAALYFGDEVDVEKFAEGCLTENFPEGCDPSQSRDLLRESLSKHVHDVVQENYDRIEAALEGKN